MQMDRNSAIHPNLSALAVCLILSCIHVAADPTPLQITDASLLDGTLALAWSPGGNSYEVQRTDSLAAPNWTTVLATVRTNAAFPLTGTSGYYRLQNPATNSDSLVLTMTNLTTADSLTLSLEPQTNTDLVFDLPSGANGVGLTQIIVAGTELQKFDIAFPSDGFFTIETNGVATAWGGSWTNSPGPGTNEITYQGYLTNGVDVVMFSAEGVIGGIIGTINWWRCSGQFAAPYLQCQAACTSQALACAFQFQGSYCKFVTHVTVAFDGSINCGTYECLHGCGAAPAATHAAVAVASAPDYLPDDSHANEPLPEGIIAWDAVEKTLDATNGQEFAEFAFAFTNIAAKMDIALATNVICLTNVTVVTHHGLWARISGHRHTSVASIVRHTNTVTVTNSIVPMPITILAAEASCGCTQPELPSLPWVLPPGTNSVLRVRVDLAGQSGLVFKTVTVATDKGTQDLTLCINILPPHQPIVANARL